MALIINVIKRHQYYRLYNRGILNYFTCMKYPVLLKGLSDDDYREKFYILLIVVGAVLFYLPFISKQFIGDDWLGLAYGRKALANPAIAFERSMYGYFRPFSILILSIIYKFAGTNAYFYGLLNILFHGVNLILLVAVLKQFHTDIRIRYLSLLLYAFYFLNSSTVVWISGGGELRVTCLSLLFVLQTSKFYKNPTFKAFLLTWLLAITALLFKESGYVALGIYFLLPFLLKQSPIAGKLKWYSAAFSISFMIYIILYITTRIYADKQVDLGMGFFITIWYLLTYMFLPISRRFGETFPSEIIFLLKLIKIGVTCLIPFIILFALKKGKVAIKFFSLWSIMFIATFSIIKWNVGLFSLYPESTASRFFYTANVGWAVLMAWIIIIVYDKLNIPRYLNKYFLIAFACMVIIINFWIVNKISGIFSKQQAMADTLIEDLRPVAANLADNDTLIVLIEKISSPPDLLVESEPHLEAVLFLTFNKQIEVIVKQEPGFITQSLILNGRTKVIGWNCADSHIIMPSTENTHIP
jgi:hypothetical protein